MNPRQPFYNQHPGHPNSQSNSPMPNQHGFIPSVPGGSSPNMSFGSPHLQQLTDFHRNQQNMLAQSGAMNQMNNMGGGMNVNMPGGSGGAGGAVNYHAVPAAKPATTRIASATIGNESATTCTTADAESTNVAAANGAAIRSVAVSEYESATTTTTAAAATAAATASVYAAASVNAADLTRR